jgi:hypothetical protein
MPGKGKGKGRGKSRGKRKSESLQWKFRYQISERYLRESGQTPAEARLAALRRFDETGEELDGVHIIASWRNKDNKNPKHSHWKNSDATGQSLAGAFRTLHGSMDRAIDTPFADVKEHKEKRRGPVVSRETRSKAMKQYHADLHKISVKHPSWAHARVREEYRKRRGKK